MEYTLRGDNSTLLNHHQPYSSVHIVVMPFQLPHLQHLLPSECETVLWNHSKIPRNQTSYLTLPPLHFSPFCSPTQLRTKQKACWMKYVDLVTSTKHTKQVEHVISSTFTRRLPCTTTIARSLQRNISSFTERTSNTNSTCCIISRLTLP